MLEMPKQLNVFLCHSSQDKPAVRELYQKLCAEVWIDPWLDEEKLFPGMDWNLEIEKAVEAADAILVCLSNNSITKEGYVQRELRIVLDYADDKPEGTLYIFPVRLEDCEPPRRLRGWQYADYFPPNDRDRGYGRLLVSLSNRAKALGIHTEKLQSKTEAEPKSESSQVVKQPTKTTSGGNPIYTYGGIEFVKVPQGPFMMGSHKKDELAYDREKPRHQLSIPYDFFIARYPVTNEQFSEYGKATKEKRGWGRQNWENYLKHPVVNVTGYLAIAFCDWLNETYGESVPDRWRFRLPTEAEWEKAARGNTEYVYPWGDHFDSNKCNSIEGWTSKKDATTTPVGAYSPRGDSPWGVCDMAGNVWEWTASLWGKKKDAPDFMYPYDPRDGREDLRLVDDTIYVARGGSFIDNLQSVRAPIRHWYFIQDWYTNYGFRVVLAPRDPWKILDYGFIPPPKDV